MNYESPTSYGIQAMARGNVIQAMARGNVIQAMARGNVKVLVHATDTRAIILAPTTNLSRLTQKDPLIFIETVFCSLMNLISGG